PGASAAVADTETAARATPAAKAFLIMGFPRWALWSRCARRCGKACHEEIRKSSANGVRESGETVTPAPTGIPLPIVDGERSGEGLDAQRRGGVGDAICAARARRVAASPLARPIASRRSADLSPQAGRGILIVASTPPARRG